MIQTTTGYYSRIECACGRSSGAREAPTHGGPKHATESSALSTCPNPPVPVTPGTGSPCSYDEMHQARSLTHVYTSLQRLLALATFHVWTRLADMIVTLSGTTLSMLGALLVLGRTVPRRLVCFLACIDFLQGLFLLCIRLVVFMFMLLRLVFLARVF
jgi:hypothetical protein